MRERSSLDKLHKILLWEPLSSDRAVSSAPFHFKNLVANALGVDLIGQDSLPCRRGRVIGKIASISRNIWLIVVKDETWVSLPIYAFALERIRLGKPKLFRPYLRQDPSTIKFLYRKLLLMYKDFLLKLSYSTDRITQNWLLRFFGYRLTKRATGR